MKRFLHVSLMLIALWCFAQGAMAQIVPDGTVIYVKQGASGSGQSWADAADLSEALKNPNGATEIWVAAGTYVPKYKAAEVALIDDYPNPQKEVAASERDRAFVLPAGVAVYGGFDGTEDVLSKRNPAINVTTLSGEIGGSGIADNCYHVVIGAGDMDGAILDGFTITGGNADDSDPNSQFGNNYGIITVNGAIIDRNISGGIYANLAAEAVNPLVVSGNIIHKNTAYSAGGGAFISYTILTGNTIYENISQENAGGVDAQEGCIINHNTIYRNIASKDGGGLSIYGGQQNADRCFLTNNLIYENEAVRGGGAFITDTYLINNTIYGNTAESEGSGVYTYYVAYSLVNNIIWSAGETKESLYVAGDIETLSNNLIDSYKGGSSSSYTIDDTNLLGDLYDPRFTDAANGDFSLQANSPAIGAGSVSAYNAITNAPDTDIVGYPRISDNTICIGAYEYTATQPLNLSVLYVSPNGLSGGNGSSWKDALTSLSDALRYSHANPGTVDSILIAAGTYYPESYAGISGDDLTTRDYTFLIPAGVSLKGGYNPADTAQAPNPGEYLTILSGDLDKNGEFSDGDAYHVVLAVGDMDGAIFDGFTITGGHANGDWGSKTTVNEFEIYRYRGGGIYINGSNLTISHNNIEGNNAIRDGGGLYTYRSDENPEDLVVVSENTLRLNTANSTGGGADITHTILTNNTICNNFAKFDGGGVYARSSSVFNNTIYKNEAEDQGGGVRTYTTNDIKGIVANNLIYDNKGKLGGGVFAQYTALTNNTIYGNTTTDEGSEAYLYNEGNSLENNIIWGVDDAYKSLHTNAEVGPISNNIIDSYLFDTSNDFTLDDTNLLGDLYDPRFTDAANGDFSLQANSPAIGAGSVSAYNAITNAPDTDIVGNPRISDNTICIGAYECSATQPLTHSVLYVSPNGLSGGDGSSWKYALTSLSDALLYSNANPGTVDSILIAAGTYYPESYAGFTPVDGSYYHPLTERDYTFLITTDVVLEGGYNPADTTQAPNPAVYETILSGDIDGVPGFSAGDAYHVMVVAGKITDQNGQIYPIRSTVRGLTITGGYSKDITTSTYARVENTLTDIINYVGPGIYNIYADTHFDKIRVVGNQAQASAMLIEDSVPILTSVAVTGNRCTNAAGITVFNMNGHNLQERTILFNSVTIAGNAVDVETYRLNGLSFGPDSKLKIVNSVIWGNGKRISDINVNNSVVSFHHSLVEDMDLTTGDYAGNGNLNGTQVTTSPFMDWIDPDGSGWQPTTAGNYSPRTGSPLIDKGLISSYDSELDLAGNPRLNGERIDIGAYEWYYSPEEPETPDLSYQTITLAIAPGITSHGYEAGELSVEKGGRLFLQFKPEDNTLTAEDILFLLDGEEMTFDVPAGDGYCGFLMSPIDADHTVLIALREYTITFPEIEGLTITTAPTTRSDLTGETIKVAYGAPYSFTLTSETLDLSALKVFANGTELTPAADGTYTIDKVEGPITITVEGITTGNASLTAQAITLSIVNSQLSIVNSGSAVDVAVYAITGQTVAQVRALRGSQTISLRPGVYVVRAGNTNRKIIINY